MPTELPTKSPILPTMYDVGGKNFSVGVKQMSVGIVLTSDTTSTDDERYRRKDLLAGVNRKIVFVVLINDRSLDQ